MKTSILLLALVAFQPLAAQDVCLSAGERELYNLIMDYRKTRKLPAIPYSAKLTQVAQAHVRDLVAHFDYEKSGVCNHSWSANWKLDPLLLYLRSQAGKVHVEQTPGNRRQ